jgi:aryl-alcohol dehydrogenase-like predicted oxidoreductase
MKSLAVSERQGFARYIAHQAYYSLLGREFEWELMPLALDQKVGTVAWSPLGMGRLGGKLRRGQPLPAVSRLHDPTTQRIAPPADDEFVFRIVEVLDELARETEHTVAQVALNWVLQRPSVSSVIIGARNETQLRENLGAAGWALSAAQIARLDAASAKQRTYPYWHQAQFPERNPFPTG